MNRPRIWSAVFLGGLLVLLLVILLPRGERQAREASGPRSHDGSGGRDPRAAARMARGAGNEDRRGDGRNSASGRVLDEKKEPIPAATLLVRSGPRHLGSPVISETTAGADGAFEVVCREGAWIEAQARGFQRSQVKLECKTGLDIHLAAGTSIDGVVIRKSDKSPVEGTRVFCTYERNMQPMEEMITDARGAFSLSSCGTGALELYAEHEGYAPAWTSVGEVGVTDNIRGVVIELATGRLLAGRVVDASGVPVSGADVVSLEGESQARARMVTSDENGRFQMTISREKHLVGAMVADGRVTQERIAAGAESPKAVELRLPAWSHVLRGRLVGDVTNARVRAYRDHADYQSDELADLRETMWVVFGRFSFYREAKVTADRFEISGVEPGRYRLDAQSATASGHVSVRHDDPDIVIHLRSTGSLTLRVTWEDGQPADGMVSIQGADRQYFYGSEDGVLAPGTTFAPGEYRATYYPPEGPLPAPTVFEVRPGQNDVSWTLSHPTVLVRGRVVDAATNEGVPGAQVSVAREWGDEAWVGDERRFVTTDGEGGFETTVASLSDRLFVRREGYVSALVPANEAGLVRLTSGESKGHVRKRPAADRGEKNRSNRSTSLTQK